MMGYLSTFFIGVKRIAQFKGWIIGEIMAQTISILLLVTLWSSLVQTDFSTYFIVVFFLLGAGRASLYTHLTHTYDDEVRTGWSVALAKPISWFFFTALYTFGSWFFSFLVGAVAGSVLLIAMGVNFSFLVFFLSVPFILLFDLAVAYFISSFSYFVYSTWGIRVFFSVMETIFGGIVVPLALVPEKYMQAIVLLPFPHKAYEIAVAILHGSIPLPSYIALIIWSAFFFLIGYIMHRKGRARFESLGG